MGLSKKQRKEHEETLRTPGLSPGKGDRFGDKWEQIQSDANKRCSSFKGDAKVKCVDNFVRNLRQTDKRHEEGYQDNYAWNRARERQEKREAAKERRLGKSVTDALKVIENKRKYGEEWTKKGVEGSVERWIHIKKGQRK